jgi:hypothetical protein
MVDVDRNFLTAAARLLRMLSTASAARGHWALAFLLELARAEAEDEAAAGSARAGCGSGLRGVGAGRHRVCEAATRQELDLTDTD